MKFVPYKYTSLLHQPVNEAKGHNLCLILRIMAVIDYVRWNTKLLNINLGDAYSYQC
jgi:hypothetical protein